MRELLEQPVEYEIHYLFSEHMCAASPGKDACQGDSGGPMFLFENSR